VSNYRSREMREMREALKAFTDADVAFPRNPSSQGRSQVFRAIPEADGRSFMSASVGRRSKAGRPTSWRSKLLVELTSRCRGCLAAGVAAAFCGR
jgi:hypothetical protein